MTSALARRRALLTAALGFMQLDRWNEPKPPVMTTLVGWMDSWPGIGAVVVGMAAQGCDLQLTEYAEENWRRPSALRGRCRGGQCSARRGTLRDIDRQCHTQVVDPSHSPSI
jgi:hypothetical protein